MDLVVGPQWFAVHTATAIQARQMILLDTNALIWLAQGHRRASNLARSPNPLYASPASLPGAEALAL